VEPLAAARFLLIGNPENRRVTLFQQALAQAGLAPARVLSWLQVLGDMRVLSSLPDAPLFVRLESPGESAAVERALLLRGWRAAHKEGCSTLSPAELQALVPQHGRILAPRQAHLGFLDVLEALEEVFAAHPRWRILNPPRSVAELFDKRLTSRKYAALGIPVPTALPTVHTPQQLRETMRAHGVHTVFVKLASGSSASCLAVYSRKEEREHAMTTVQQTPEGWFNSLKVCRVPEGPKLEALLAFLLAEGSQVEQAVPKARLSGHTFDCRVLVVAGEPAFTVVRQSRHIITNLHLGGWRGSLTELAARVPPEVHAAAMDSCRRVHAAHGCLHVGVDLMYEAGFGGHRVLEANAFGDLLPNLTREGLSTYGWEIRATLAIGEGGEEGPLPPA
jgi:glutathione synthase/RimK-type ligase-like ATP-grasp enzyme